MEGEGGEKDLFRQPAERRSAEEWLRRQEEYTRGRRRFEILRSCETPEAVFWATRGIVAGEETVETTEPPNRFTRDSVREALDDRINELRMRLNSDLLKQLGLEEAIFGKGLGRNGEEIVGKEDLTQEEIKRLIDGLEAAQKEFWARWRLLEAYRQHRRAGMDLEKVTVGLFVSLEKVYPEAGWLATIGQAKETLPGAEKLGMMVDKAMRVWCDIGEGKVPGVDNIFGGPRFESTYQQALDYVTSQIVGREIQESERKYNIYWQDAQAAARLALEIFRLFDLDVAYDLECKDIPPEKQEEWNRSLKAFLLHSPGQGREWDFEGGMNSGDLAKICHFILRQTNEFGRDYPRQIGAPAVVGCFPNLTVDFMRMITVKAETQDKGKPKIEKTFNLWQLWREMGIPFGDLPWGEKEWEKGIEVLRQKGAISEAEAAREWRISGIGQDVYDAPYTLQHFYAVGTVFSAITRKDLDKAFEDCQNPNYLAGLNKGFENTFALMADGVGLGELEKTKKTMTKLRQLAKVNFLIGVLVANIDDSNKDKRKGPEKVTSRCQLSQTSILAMEVSDRETLYRGINMLIDGVIDAAERAGFLSSNPDDENQLMREKTLLLRAIGRRGKLREIAKEMKFDEVPTRRGFLPSESGWFDEEELEAIKKSGLYGPYDKV